MSDVPVRDFDLPAPGSSADRLSDRAVDYLVGPGNPRDSLRSIAEGIGTSHRMLQYHFGSRERLLAVVLLKIQQRRAPEIGPELLTRADYVRHSWNIYRQPENTIMLELLIMITSPSAGALTDETLVKRLSSQWSDALVELGMREGLSLDRAESEARLVRMAWRGMHQDLYGTGDAEGVQRAFEVLVEWLESSARD